MQPLYTLAFIIQGVFSVLPCKDGVEIVSTETKNPEDLLGNWTFVYHWEPMVNFMYTKEFYENNNHLFECPPQLHFEAITPELVKAKETECAKYRIPFNWADAKLKVNSKHLKIQDAVITFGEKENWMAIDCIKMARVVMKKVSDDYIAMVNPDEHVGTELIVREPPTLDELKCVAHNLDVGKGMPGYIACLVIST